MMDLLTDESAPGTYVVVTRSRSVYEVTISDTRELNVVRRPIVTNLLLDGEPMTGVKSVHFDSRSGFGSILWWKQHAADYDEPRHPYRGTDRVTSRVLLVAEVPAGADLVDVIRDVVLAAPDEVALRDAVRALIEA